VDYSQALHYWQNITNGRRQRSKLSLTIDKRTPDFGRKERKFVPQRGKTFLHKARGYKKGFSGGTRRIFLETNNNAGIFSTKKQHLWHFI